MLSYKIFSRLFFIYVRNLLKFRKGDAVINKYVLKLQYQGFISIQIKILTFILSTMF